MDISLIACINKANALGKDNKLLYHIKSDLSTFKTLTTHNIIIMGKNTYESLPKKPLPNRTTIIITNEKDYNPEVAEDSTVFVCDSIESAIMTAETIINNDEKIFVVGGASIYRQFLEQKLVKRMFLTVVDDDAEGDVFFPEINHEEWETIVKMPPINENGVVYNFMIMECKHKTND